MQKIKSNVDLVSFQQRLNANLEDAAAQDDVSSLLGFRVGDKQFIIDLQDLKEVDGVPGAEAIQQLALAKHWVLGISNFKGYIYTLVDLQLFLTGVPTTLSLSARSLVIHPKHLLQMALVVPEIIGLVARSDLEFKRQSQSQEEWFSGVYASSDGREWEFLNLKNFVESRDMLDIELM